MLLPAHFQMQVQLRIWTQICSLAKIMHHLLCPLHTALKGPVLHAIWTLQRELLFYNLLIGVRVLLLSTQFEHISTLMGIMRNYFTYPVFQEKIICLVAQALCLPLLCLFSLIKSLISPCRLLSQFEHFNKRNRTY